jgi:hypothetical protein
MEYAMAIGTQHLALCNLVKNALFAYLGLAYMPQLNGFRRRIDVVKIKHAWVCNPTSRASSADLLVVDEVAHGPHPLSICHRQSQRDAAGSVWPFSHESLPYVLRDTFCCAPASPFYLH